MAGEENVKTSTILLERSDRVERSKRLKVCDNDNIEYQLLCMECVSIAVCCKENNIIIMT